MYILVIIIPLIGFILSGVFGWFFGRYGSAFLSTFCLFIVWLLSLFILNEVCLSQSVVSIKLYNWILLDVYKIDFGLFFDTLSSVMIVVVLTISFFIHLYSISSMFNNSHLSRFMCYLSLFTLFLFFASLTNYVDAEVDLLSESAIIVKSYLDESIGNITNNSYNIYYKELLVEPSSKGYILLLEDLNLICSELINSEIKLIIDDYLSNHLIIKKQNADYYDIHKILVAVAWLFVAGFMAYHNIVDPEIIGKVGDQLVTAAAEVGDQLVTPAVEVVSNIPIDITAAAVEVVSNIPIDITAAAAVVGAAVVEQMVTPAVEVVSNIPIETTAVVEQMVTPAVEVVSNRSIETTLGIITYSTLSDYIRYGNENAHYLTVFDGILEPCLVLGFSIFNTNASEVHDFYNLGLSRLALGAVEALLEVPVDLAFTNNAASDMFVKFLECLRTSNLPNVLKSDERFLIWFAYNLTQWAYFIAYPEEELLYTLEFLNL